MKTPDKCDCETCIESGKPCAFDCQLDEMCDGCRAAKAAADDLPEPSYWSQIIKRPSP